MALLNFLLWGVPDGICKLKLFFGKSQHFFSTIGGFTNLLFTIIEGPYRLKRYDLFIEDDLNT
jgi:hypothetical protein